MIYPALADFHARPQPFSRYTIDALWTDPHIGKQMLAFHLNPEHDAASRRASTIDATVGWIDRRFDLAGKRVLDLGCGPGLYATRMARRGARVTGLDFSPTSIAHAKASAPGDVPLDYVLADYLAAPLPGAFDLVTLIYGDYCSLSPDRRQTLLARIAAALAPSGRLVFDVYSPGQLAALKEGVEYGHRYMNGFWAEEDYFAFKSTLLYPDDLISLERYLVATERREFEIFNWMQYFTPDSIAEELQPSGFAAEACLDLLTGEAWANSPTPFFVVGSRRSIAPLPRSIEIG